jgi:hypothetical protein
MSPGEITALHEAALSFMQIVHSSSNKDRALEVAQRVDRVMAGESKADIWLILGCMVTGLILQLPAYERRAAMAGFALLINEMGSLAP